MPPVEAPEERLRPGPGMLPARRLSRVVVLGDGTGLSVVLQGFGTRRSVRGEAAIAGAPIALLRLEPHDAAHAPGESGGGRAGGIFVCNLMTEPGRQGHGVAAHPGALGAHGLLPEALDYVVVNREPIPQEVQARYAAAGAEPVAADLAPSLGPQDKAADQLCTHHLTGVLAPGGSGGSPRPGALGLESDTWHQLEAT